MGMKPNVKGHDQNVPSMGLEVLNGVEAQPSMMRDKGLGPKQFAIYQ
jgi:hypothetical protein